MKINTKKYSTRFMDGNLDIDNVIFDMLADKYGMSDVCSLDIDICESIFSNGYILALEYGATPTLDIDKSDEVDYSREYHHLIYNNECYVMYFENN